MKIILKLFAFSAALTASSVALAHHSFSVFDTQTRMEIEGVIVKFEWTNPHTWTWVDVTNEDGSVDRWGLEGMSPNYLGRRGWTRKTFEPGDKVKLVIFPLKSGKPGGTLLNATFEDGTVVYNFGGPD